VKRTLEKALGLAGGICSFIYGIIAIVDSLAGNLFSPVTLSAGNETLVLVAGVIFVAMGAMGVVGALQADRKIKAAEVMLLVGGIITVIICVFGFWLGFVGSVLMLVGGVFCTVRKPKDAQASQA
jgi:hypothetical protein